MVHRPARDGKGKAQLRLTPKERKQLLFWCCVVLLAVVVLIYLVMRR